MRIGLNLSYCNYYQSDQKFRDLMAVAPWVEAKAYWIPAKEGYARPGPYILTAKGKGVLRFADDDIPTAQDQTVRFTGAGESYTFNLKTPKQRGLLLRVESDAADPIRDVQLYPADLVPSPGNVCHPDYVGPLAAYDTLRSLHFYNIDLETKDAAKEANWASANPKLWGLFFAVCREANRRPWICLPHLASEDYCQLLGVMCRASLPPWLKPIVEYSNEVWNWAPPWGTQSSWVNQQAKLMGIGLRQAYARLAGKAWAAFEDGFGGPVTRVLAGQSAGSETIVSSISQANADGIRFDAIASGVYMIPTIDWATVEALWAADLKPQVASYVLSAMAASLDALAPQMDRWSSIATSAKTPLLAYEWGPHFTGGNKKPRNEIAYYVNRTQGIADLITRMAVMMGSRFAMGCFYSDTDRWVNGDPFGIKEFMDDSTPKADAVAALARRWND